MAQIEGVIELHQILEELKEKSVKVGMSLYATQLWMDEQSKSYLDSPQGVEWTSFLNKLRGFLEKIYEIDPILED